MTAARIARFSISYGASDLAEAGQSLPRERGGNGVAVGLPARCRGARRVPGPPGGHTRSTSAQTGRQHPRTATGAAGSRRRRRRRPAPARSPLGPHGGAAGRRRGQRAPQLTDQRTEFHVKYTLLPNDDHRHGLWGCTPSGPVGLSQTPPDPVPIDRPPEPAADGEANPPTALRLAPEHKKRRSLDSLASVEERLKLGAGGQPLAARESAR